MKRYVDLAVGDLVRTCPDWSPSGEATLYKTWGRGQGGKDVGIDWDDVTAAGLMYPDQTGVVLDSYGLGAKVLIDDGRIGWVSCYAVRRA